MLKTAVSVLIVCAGLLVGAMFAYHPAAAQEREHRGPVIVSPTDGATLPGPVTVVFGFGGREGAQGPGEHQEGEHRRHGGHAYHVIEAPAPAPGSAVQADASHQLFPEGQRQITVTLAPGKHSLQLVLVNREGEVGRFPGAAPITVVVK